MSLKKFRKFPDSMYSKVKGQITQNSNKTWLIQLELYGVPYERYYMLLGDVIAFSHKTKHWGVMAISAGSGYFS